LPNKIAFSFDCPHKVQFIETITHKENRFKSSLFQKVILLRAHLLTARLRVVVLPDGSRALSEGETLQQAHALLVALKLETAKGSATPCLRHP